MILIHANQGQVDRLISHLSKSFDVYIHIDKCSSTIIKETGNIFVSKEYKTYWGSFNLVLATLYILKKAYKKDYDRYLLISGQDLPIKTNINIINFFTSNNFEYIHSEKFPCPSWKRFGGGFAHIIKFWPIRKFHDQNISFSRIIFILKRLFCEFVAFFWKRPLNYVFYGGSQWFNLTNKCVKGIFEYLRKDPKYIKRFRWTSCSDEIFFQTVVNMIPGLKIANMNLRYIDWRGPERPKTLRLEDYEAIVSSDNLFARKFNSDVDNEIINSIYKHIEEC